MSSHEDASLWGTPIPPTPGSTAVSPPASALRLAPPPRQAADAARTNAAEVMARFTTSRESSALTSLSDGDWSSGGESSDGQSDSEDDSDFEVVGQSGHDTQAPAGSRRNRCNDTPTDDSRAGKHMLETFASAEAAVTEISESCLRAGGLPTVRSTPTKWTVTCSRNAGRCPWQVVARRLLRSGHDAERPPPPLWWYETINRQHNHGSQQVAGKELLPPRPARPQEPQQTSSAHASKVSRKQLKTTTTTKSVQGPRKPPAPTSLIHRINMPPREAQTGAVSAPRRQEPTRSALNWLLSPREQRRLSDFDNEWRAPIMVARAPTASLSRQAPTTSSSQSEPGRLPAPVAPPHSQVLRASLTAATQSNFARGLQPVPAQSRPFLPQPSARRLSPSSSLQPSRATGQSREATPGPSSRASAVEHQGESLMARLTASSQSQSPTLDENGPRRRRRAGHAVRERRRRRYRPYDSAEYGHHEDPRHDQPQDYQRSGGGEYEPDRWARYANNGASSSGGHHQRHG